MFKKIKNQNQKLLCCFNVNGIDLIKLLFMNMLETLYKKRSFPLRISSANVTKSAIFCEFGHIY